jgi:FMN phosphatase YigB (HAD superfamily)
MVKNDGSRSNEQAFWDTFCALFGEGVRQDEPHFEDYYREDFQKVKEACGFAPEAAKVVALCREKGWQVVLATNPIFPAVATESRIRWAGLQPEDFALYTTYENSCHCKPNLDYYRDILAKIGCQPEECLMIGNDAGEDVVAKTLGMSTFLLTDCLISKEKQDISAYPSGGFAELCSFLQNV